jgi:hypothetical protein
MMFSILLNHPGIRVIIQEIEILQSVVDAIGSIMHFQPILLVSPAIVWAFQHFSSRNSVTSIMLMAWGIIEKKKAGHNAIHFPLENIDWFFNLFEQAISREPSISIFSGFEYNTSLPVQKSINIWLDHRVKLLTHPHH